LLGAPQSRWALAVTSPFMPYLSTSWHWCLQQLRVWYRVHPQISFTQNLHTTSFSCCIVRRVLSGLRLGSCSPQTAMLSHTPNCTLPVGTVNFSASPNVRGTFDILYTCLATMVICTWSSLHLNVPDQRCGRDPGWLGDMKWAARRSWDKIRRTLIILIVPELAYIETQRSALISFWEYRRLQGDVPKAQRLSLTQVLFANMGGFVVSVLAVDSHCYRHSSPGRRTSLWSTDRGYDNDYHEPIEDEQESQNDHGSICATTQEPVLQRASTHAAHSSATSSTIGFPVPPCKWEDRALATASQGSGHKKLLHLTAHSLIRLIERGHILTQLPREEEIADKSKGDIITKCVMILQTGYFILSLGVCTCQDRIMHHSLICDHFASFKSTPVD